MIPEITEARAAADILGANLPREVDVAVLGVRSKAPFQLLCAREALVWRTEELARNACDALERDDFAAAALLVRGVAENAALAWKLMDVLNNRNEYSPAELNKHLTKVLLGWKNEPGDLPAAYNVLTLIQKMDRVVTGVLGTYNSLSEIAHPNWSGVLALYGDIDHENCVTKFGRGLRHRDRNGIMISNALLGSLSAFRYAYNKISDDVLRFLGELESLWPEEDGS